jgi:hypothetical protein
MIFADVIYCIGSKKQFLLSNDLWKFISFWF